MAEDFMNRIYASLGLAAIGVASIQSVQAQSTDPSRPWSVSASLRGFYDDNVNTVESSADKIESFGFEVSPSISLFLPLERTTISAGYTYAYKWYEKEINNQDGHDDQTHTIAAQLRHAFSERFLMSVQDAFVIGQEPDTLRVANSGLDTFQRISGDNIRNYGDIVFNAQITRLFGVEVGYANALFDYDDDSPGGYSALLDRLENTPHVNARWTMRPDTIGIVGYAFNWTDYTADLPLQNIPGYPFMSDTRNYRSHYGYVGLEHTFRPDVVGTVKGGVRYSDFYNSPGDESNLSPYGQASLRWTYAKESFLDFGLSYDLTSTDQYTYDVLNNSMTVGAESLVAYIALTHRILPKLYGSLVFNYQHSTFIGGYYDNKTQDYYSFGANLEYRFNRYVSANVGYNFDDVCSDPEITNGNFDRNRAYIGATFTY